MIGTHAIEGVQRLDENSASDDRMCLNDRPLFHIQRTVFQGECGSGHRDFPQIMQKSPNHNTLSIAWSMPKNIARFTA